MTKSLKFQINKIKALLGLQIISDFGDQVTVALLALSVLSISESTKDIGLIYLVKSLGYLIFTFLGGFFGDRLNKKNILIISDTIRSAVVLLMIVAFKTNSIYLIYLTSFCLSIFGALNRPTRQSIWTHTIPNKKLEVYNGRSELSLQLSEVCGPIIASFFVLQNLVSLGFALDALTFIVCAVVFQKILYNDKFATIVTKSKKNNIFSGILLVIKNPSLAKYIYYDAIQMIGFGATNATFLILAQRDFGWSTAQYSYHLSIVAAFTVTGAAIGSKSYITKFPLDNRLFWGALLSSSTLLLGLYLEAFPGSSLLIGFCDGIAILTTVATRSKVALIAKQKHLKEMASVLAARSIFIKLGTVAGVLTCLYVDNFFSLKTTLSLSVFFIFATALLFFKTAFSHKSQAVSDNINA